MKGKMNVFKSWNFAKIEELWSHTPVAFPILLPRSISKALSVAQTVESVINYCDIIHCTMLFFSFCVFINLLCNKEAHSSGEKRKNR